MTRREWKILVLGVCIGWTNMFIAATIYLISTGYLPV